MIPGTRPGQTGARNRAIGSTGSPTRRAVADVLGDRARSRGADRRGAASEVHDLSRAAPKAGGVHPPPRTPTWRSCRKLTSRFSVITIPRSSLTTMPGTRREGARPAHPRRDPVPVRRPRRPTRARRRSPARLGRLGRLAATSSGPVASRPLPPAGRTRRDVPGTLAGNCAPHSATSVRSGRRACVQPRTAVASISTRWSGTSSAATPRSVAGGTGVVPSFAAAREIPSRSGGILSGVQSTT